jgi:transcriptional regulator with XRE-family HTH domain
MFSGIYNLRQAGLAIKAERKSLGFSQIDLAKKAMVSRQTIINVENGADVNLSTLIKLLLVMGKRLEIKDSRPDVDDIQRLFNES